MIANKTDILWSERIIIIKHPDAHRVPRIGQHHILTAVPY